MKALTLTALLLTGSFAQAQTTKTIECSFTEPFFALTVDLEKKTVTRVEPDWENDAGKTKSTVIARGIRVKTNMKDVFRPEYKILAADGSVVAEMTFDNEGSNGMSDTVFPYSMKYDGMLGGCSSDRVKSVEPRY